MFLLTDGNESEKDFLYLFQVETAEVIGLKGTFDVDPGRGVFTLFTTRYLLLHLPNMETQGGGEA